MSYIRLKECDIRALYDLEDGDDFMPYDQKNVERLRKLSYEKYFNNEYYCIDPIEFLKTFKDSPIEDAEYYLLKCQAESRLDLYRNGKGYDAWDDYESDEEDYTKYYNTEVDNTKVDNTEEVAIDEKTTIVELRKKCKQLGLKGYSKKNKIELLNILKTGI